MLNYKFVDKRLVSSSFGSTYFFLRVVCWIDLVRFTLCNCVTITFNIDGQIMSFLNTYANSLRYVYVS